MSALYLATVTAMMDGVSYGSDRTNLIDRPTLSDCIICSNEVRRHETLELLVGSAYRRSRLNFSVKVPSMNAGAQSQNLPHVCKLVVLHGSDP